MITFLTGTPGTGKSLNAVKRYVVPALKNDRVIYTNIPLSIMHLAIFLKKDEFSVENLIKPYEKYTYKEVKGNSLIIIDEAQNFYNNRDFKEQDNKDFNTFLTQHRHFGIDVLILTQHFEQVDLGIRRNCETCIVLKSLRNLGLSKQIKAEFYGNALDIARKPVASQRWTVDSSFYSLYKSYDSEQVVEVKTKSFNVILRSPLVWLMFVVIGLVLYNVFAGKYGFLVGKKENNLLAVGIGGTPHLAAPPPFVLGDCEEYYCGDKFYILRKNGLVDTVVPKSVPAEYCPKLGYSQNCSNIQLEVKK